MLKKLNVVLVLALVVISATLTEASPINQVRGDSLAITVAATVGGASTFTGLATFNGGISISTSTVNNLAGGAAGYVPYQSAAGVTLFVSTPAQTSAL